MQSASHFYEPQRQHVYVEPHWYTFSLLWPHEPRRGTLQAFWAGGRWRSWQNTQVVERQMRQGRRTLAAGRVKKPKKKTRTKSAPPKTHHESHSSPATTTASRRHMMKHVPRVRPHSPASIDPGFVEIGLVQLSQSAKTTNVTHTLIDRQTDRQTDRRTDRLIKRYNSCR